MALFAAMKLSALLREIEVLRIDGAPGSLAPNDAQDDATANDGRAALDSVEIREVRDDSRAVEPGDLFVAVRGLTVDGHRFIEDAARRGAAAVVVEDGAAAASFPGPRIVVTSSMQTLAHLASRRYGDPSRHMTMLAVTGTNGKTTTTYLIESILRTAGHRVGVLGTVNYRYGGGAGPDVEKPSNFTTPMPLDLHRVLAEMREAGCTHVVMETSSHALALGRLEGIAFRAAAFTNLTQDHLDLHETMEAYYDAKATLFRRCLRHGDGVGVILTDGSYGERMTHEVSGERLLVSLSSKSADVHVRAATTSIDGITAELVSPLGPLRIRSQLLGAYNLANIAVASAVAVSLGIDAALIERGVAALSGVPGRVQRVELPPGAPSRPILVDYAHTPDALENVIGALRPLTAGRLLCVFGCGGDRDRGKRPKMGRAVAERADLCIVTSDNPRTEEPGAIVEDILVGVREAGAVMLERAQLASASRGAWVEIDRRVAIVAAVFAMQQNDVLLIAGKGHEDYQIIGKTKHPFDDRLVARDALERLVHDGQKQEP